MSSVEPGWRTAPQGDGWGRHPSERGWSHGGLPTGMLTGLALVGLGALAFYYLGPDLRRYLKIERM
jgi:hypothetical protein